MKIPPMTARELMGDWVPILLHILLQKLSCILLQTFLQLSMSISALVCTNFDKDSKSSFSEESPELSKLGFVRCNSWRQNKTILLGDSCHATVPFYGQGMNSGFEDCYLLNEWLNTFKSLTNQNLDHFLNNRKVDTTAMQDLSMHNYIEMRDKTADSDFLLQKKIEMN